MLSDLFLLTPKEAKKSDGQAFRRNQAGKIDQLVFDCTPTGLTVEIENCVSYTILEDEPAKIDVQFVFGNNAFAECVEIHLQGWKYPLEVLQWVPFEPEKDSELLGGVKGLIIQNTSSTSMKITFPFNVTALWNEGEGSLVIKDKW